jgi:hypothetical protein
MIWARMLAYITGTELRQPHARMKETRFLALSIALLAREIGSTLAGPERSWYRWADRNGFFIRAIL